MKTSANRGTIKSNLPWQGKPSTPYLFLSCPWHQYTHARAVQNTELTKRCTVIQMTLLIILFGLSGTSTLYWMCSLVWELMPDVINFRILGGIFCLEDMSSYPLNGDVSNQVSGWEQTPSYAPTPGNFGREPTPSVFCPSPAYTYGDPSFPSHRPASYCLGFLEYTGLNRRGTHNGDTPESIAYLIE